MHGQEKQRIDGDKARRIQSLPIWQGSLSFRALNGGISNESWLVKDDHTTRVVRLGENYPFHHVDRTHEAMVARAAHKAGFAPEVIHAEPGLMVSQFLDARTYDSAAVCNDLIRIAGFVRDFHNIMPRYVTGYARLFWVFHVVRDYARTLSEHASRHTPRLEELLQTASALDAAQIPLPLIYGHNDLLPANFLEAEGRLWLIDFEYAGYSTAMFDLAGLSSNAGFDDAQSSELLAHYFGLNPDRAMLRAFEAMQCASLMREAMWSMISELFLKAPGTDYEAYTAIQLAAYEAKLAAYQSRHGKISAP